MRATILVLSLCLLPVVAFAGDAVGPQTPDESHCASSSRQTPAGPQLPLQPPGEAVELSSCTATAYCGVHGNIQCSGFSTCTAVDRNCYAGENGYVSCDGNSTPCPSSSSCESGCDWEYLECINGCGPDSCLYQCNDDRNLCKCLC